MRATLGTWLLAMCTLTLTAAGCDGGRLDPADWPDVPPGFVPNDGGGVADAGVDAGGTCVPTRQFWETEVWDGFMSSSCVLCHTSAGVAAGSRLVLDDSGAPGALDSNFDVASQLAGIDEGAGILLVVKPTGAVPHGGGPQITVGSPQHDALLAFVDRVANPVTCDSPGTPTPDPEPDAATTPDQGQPDIVSTPDEGPMDAATTPDEGPMDTASTPDADPVTPMTYRVEGEDGTNTFGSGVGQASGSAYHMWAVDTVTNTVTVPADGNYTLRASLWQDYCCGEDAQYALILDGNEAATGSIAATDMAGAELVETTVTLMAGDHSIGVRFLNDANDANSDRNLWIDYFELYGPLP